MKKLIIVYYSLMLRKIIFLGVSACPQAETGAVPELLITPEISQNVIPVKTGIQYYQ